jgi:hypothetical protein
MIGMAVSAATSMECEVTLPYGGLMKTRFIATTTALAAATLGLTGAGALASAPAGHGKVPQVTVLRPMYDKGVSPNLSGSTRSALAAPHVPMFHRTVTDGKRSFPYTMVGKDPFKAHANAKSTVNTVIVPITIVLPNGDRFNPTVADSCAPSSSVARTLASPLFTAKKYSWGGTIVGKGQYVSVFQRAEFYSQTKPTGLNPDLQVTLAPTTLNPITVHVPTADAAEASINCGHVALMEINWWDNYVQKTLMPKLAAQGFGSGDFPLFLLSNVAEYITNTNNCCVLGYHNAFTNPADGGTTTYGVALFDNTHGAFGSSADITVLTHEIAEWMNDPLVNGVDNNTKPWGHIGQVSGCQANLEVGDPLSGTVFPTTLGGQVWHPQELAFFSWFYHQNPSLGVNGWFSSNGTFTQDANPCS